MDNIVSLREFIIRTRWVKKCPRRGVGARDPRAFSEKRKSSFSRNWTNILIDFILHTQARVRRVRHDHREIAGTDLQRSRGCVHARTSLRTRIPVRGAVTRDDAENLHVCLPEEKHLPPRGARPSAPGSEAVTVNVTFREVLD